MDRPSPVPSPAGFVVKNGFKHLLLHLKRNASAVVADPDFDAVAKVFGRGSKSWLVIAANRLSALRLVAA